MSTSLLMRSCGVTFCVEEAEELRLGSRGLDMDGGAVF
jgi:hypothetical protein